MRLSLPASQWRLLNQIRDAGPDGLPFEGTPMGDAVLLALDDLVRPSRADRRIYLTPKGEELLERTDA